MVSRAKEKPQPEGCGLAIWIGQLAFEHIAEFLIKFVHATSAVHNFLFAGVERMAFRADLDMEAFFFHGGAGGKFIAARAVYSNIMVCRMDIGFH